MDIEKERAVSRVVSEFMQNSNDALPFDSMLAVWTVKEAFLKLTGEGIRRNMRGLTVSADRFVSDGSQRAHYRTISFAENYILSICSFNDFDDDNFNINSFTYKQALKQLEKSNFC